MYEDDTNFEYQIPKQFLQPVQSEKVDYDYAYHPSSAPVRPEDYAAVAAATNIKPIAAFEQTNKSATRSDHEVYMELSAISEEVIKCRNSVLVRVL